MSDRDRMTDEEELFLNVETAINRYYQACRAAGKLPLAELRSALVDMDIAVARFKGGHYGTPTK